MRQRICTYVVGALVCAAVAATGWDAEAGWRRHHRQASCCWEPVCCETVYDPCCQPVCRTVCDPCCTTACSSVCVTRVVEPSCCWTDCNCSVVRETVIVPASSCCDGRIVAVERPAEATGVGVAEAARAGGAVRNASTSSVRTTRTAAVR